MGKIFDRVESCSKGKRVLPVLCLISFAESSFFPIPPDVLLIPGIIINRRKAYTYAFYCSVFSVLGGVLGYLIGMYLFDLVGSFIIETYNYQDHFKNFSNYFQNYGFWIIVLKGFTPIPYKLITISSGFLNIDIFTFVMASILARGGRFYMLSYLCLKFGPSILQILKKHMILFLLGVVVFIILGFLLFTLF